MSVTKIHMSGELWIFVDSFLIVNILFFQDWQEILSLYEKDNAYLGTEQKRYI